MEIRIECTGTENIDLDNLVELQGNLKDLSKENYTRLKDSIIKYGFSFPMFVWKNEGKNYIIDAHQRKKTLQKLKEEGCEIPPLPTVFINAKDRIEAKEKLLQLNSNYGKITQDGLYEFINEPGSELDFEELKMDIDLPDIDMDKFNAEFYEDESDGSEDEVPDVPENPISVLGDLWILGDHRLLCGDSTKKEDVERLMDGEKADMVFTDPPYDLKIDLIYDAFDIIKNYSDFQLWMGSDKQIVQLSSRFFNLFTTFFIHDFKAPTLLNNHMPMSQHTLIAKFGKGKMKNLCDGFSTIVKVATMRGHKSVDGFNMGKRVELPQTFISHYSNKNNIIVDLFSGSGSTLIACEKTNRKFFGIEMDGKMCDVIIKRWQEHCGDYAHKIDSGHKVLFNDLCFA